MLRQVRYRALAGVTDWWIQVSACPWLPSPAPAVLNSNIQ